MKAVIYLRVSTSKQDYEMQRNQLTNYFNVRNIEIVGVYEEKWTGMDDDRPEFNKLLHLTRKDCDYIGVWAIDRLARKMSTVVKTIELFNERKICVCTIKEQFQSLNENFIVSPTTTIMLGMFSSVAEVERLNLLERTRNGRKQKIKMGVSPFISRTPIGYKNINKQIVVDEDEAEIVRNTFKAYLSGASTNDLANALKTSRSTIKRMLKNPIYIGIGKTKLLDEPIAVAPIIDKVLYNQVQARIRQQTQNGKGRKSTFNPLAKVVRCGVCGHYLVRHHRNDKNQTYYCCESPCQKTNISGEDLEKIVRYIIQQHIDEFASNSDEKTRLEDLLAELLAKQKTLKASLAERKEKVKQERDKLQVLMGVFTLEDLKKEVNEVKKQENSISIDETELSRIEEKAKEIERHINQDFSEENINIDDMIHEHLTEAYVWSLKNKMTKYLRFSVDFCYIYEVLWNSYNKKSFCIQSNSPSFEVIDRQLYDEGMPTDMNEILEAFKDALH